VVAQREGLSGSKRLVAYVAVGDKAGAEVSELRAVLQAEFPEYMLPSAFVLMERLPLTVNGKVDRQALPEPPQEMGAYVAPRTRAERILADIWSRVLRVEQVGVHDNFFELGGDSILSIQVSARANQAGLQMRPRQIFERQTIAGLARLLGTDEALLAPQTLVTGTAPLTPAQLWLLEQKLPALDHYNQSVLLRAHGLDPAGVERCIDALMRRHDALRLRLRRGEAVCEQYWSPMEETLPFTFFNLSSLPAHFRQSALEKAADALQRTLNLTSGPVIRVAQFRTGHGEDDRLLIIIHHFAVDGVSWRILLEDLQTAYEQWVSGRVVQLPLKTSSFQQWAVALRESACAEAVRQQRAYWLAPEWRSAGRLDRDYTDGLNTVGSERTLGIELGENETDFLLRKAPALAHVGAQEILLTALSNALIAWTGGGILIDVEDHGREESLADGLDLSRTVGWFTNIHPVLFTRDDRRDLALQSQELGARLRSLPQRGIGYGLLRYLTPQFDGVEPETEWPAAEVSFNYHGRVDTVLDLGGRFAPAPESAGAWRDAGGLRKYLLDINAAVQNDRLRMRWSYSSNVHSPDTIERLSEQFLQTLDRLIERLLALRPVTERAVDLSLARLQDGDFGNLLEELKNSTVR
jgi:non-ribosomal peptide synthase protein (TIGR01720 family)